MRKILMVSPGWVGDAVMAHALIRQIKHDTPDVTIDMLGPVWSEALASRMNEVSSFIPLPVGHGELKLSERSHIAKQLRKEKYDQAIVLPNSLKSAFIPWWANIPERTGWRGEYRYGLLNDLRILDKAQYPLLIQRYTQLAKTKAEPPVDKCFYPKLSVDTSSVFAAREKHNVKTESPVVGFCPGAEYGPAKQWPANHFAVLATSLKAQGFDIWIFGSEKDKGIAKEINTLSDDVCTDLTGKTDLGEAIDLLSLTNCVITNDSGLMHISAALGKLVVALYGSSSPEYTPPLSKKAKVVSLRLPCSPCFERRCPLGHTKCLQELYPEVVESSLRELMHENSHN